MENFNSSINSTSVFDYGETFDSNMNDSEISCPDHNSASSDVKFVFLGVGITFLTLFGIPANVLCVIVLKHPNMKSSLTTLLLGQAISDIFVIITTLFLYSFSLIFDYVKIFPWYNAILHPLCIPRLIPIAYIAQMSSVYFTLVVTLERYIAVCLPFKARSFCTQSTARNSSIAVIILSILYNMPRWFEYKAVPCSNGTEILKYVPIKKKMRLNADYIFYYVSLSYLLVFHLIPFSLLLFFNITIYCKAKKQRRYRINSLSSTSSAPSSTNSEDLALAGMLFGIVITFLVCNMLSIVISLVEIFWVDWREEFSGLTPISYFLIIFACSTNFVFYCMFGSRFRSQMARTLGINKWLMKNSKDNSSDNNSRRNSNDNSLAKNQRTRYISESEMDETKPNAIENHLNEVSCSQVTVTTILSD